MAYNIGTADHNSTITHNTNMSSCSVDLTWFQDGMQQAPNTAPWRNANASNSKHAVPCVLSCLDT
eukprot:579354-Pyramimonas_sp.AAC.1